MAPAETFGFINQTDTGRKMAAVPLKMFAVLNSAMDFVLPSILLLLSGIGEYAVHSYSVKE
jgi:hypothetical protein